jgi:hypothetical protein
MKNIHRIARAEIINAIGEKINAKDYLEIGCAYNDCFDLININTKVGIDPHSGGTLRMTSDEFFKVNLKNFDIIFIDGLHEHEQVLKDFNNSRKFLRLGGVIVLHDMLPPTKEHGIWPFDDASPAPRCGTSWRVNFDIIHEHKKYFIINVETGMGVWQDKDQEHIWGGHCDPKTVKYEKFREHWSELPIIDFDRTKFYAAQHMYFLDKL